MKERPIPFSAPMVRAILNGTKTQTRRIMKPQPTVSEDGWFSWNGHAPNSPYSAYATNHIDKESLRLFVGPSSPYGKPGDQLWVRERFQPLWADGFDWDSHIKPDYKTGFGYDISYPATHGIVEWIDGDDNITDRCRPSIHMPRWASRISLEILAVRVEQLNDISKADAEAEGIEGINRPIGGDDYETYWRDYSLSDADADGWPYLRDGKQVESYKTLWEKINGKGSWDENPWVWVVEFKRIEPGAA